VYISLARFSKDEFPFVFGNHFFYALREFGNLFLPMWNLMKVAKLSLPSEFL
jgi:hypothetical protein